MGSYVTGTGIEIPGLEAVLQYGDSSTISHDEIPGAIKINDKSGLEKSKLIQIDGLHDDPEGRDTRSANPDRHGERAGVLFYGGRTIGLTGRVEAGNINAMRDQWAVLRRTFGTSEQDMLIAAPSAVPSYVNSLPNPSFENGLTKGWGADVNGTASSSTLAVVAESGANVLQDTVVATSGSGRIKIDPLLEINGKGAAWSGEDLFIAGRIKIHSTTASMTDLGVMWSFKMATGIVSNAPSVSQQVLSPVTGTWYSFAVRVPASEIDPRAVEVAVQLYAGWGGAGTHVVRCDNVMLALIKPDEPTPAGYFDGDTPGFEWTGTRRDSTSYGPCYTANLLADPKFESLGSATKYWYVAANTGVTATVDVTSSAAFGGSLTQTSCYAKITKDNNSTSRDLEVGGYYTNHSWVPVNHGRTYRWSARMRALAVPATGTLQIRLKWLDLAGAVLSTSSSTISLASGTGSGAVTAAAPSGAMWCIPLISVVGTTTALGVFEVLVADPCLVDISDFQQQAFNGGADPSTESPAYLSNLALARRRIPRPFLIRGVRKTSDMKSPEQQKDGRAWRDFSMSLRASDPRIYVLDKSFSYAQLTGTPQIIVVNNFDAQVAAGSSVGSANLSGWTREGESGLTGWNWNTMSIFAPPWHGISVGDSSNAAGSAPAADAIERAYKSSEGYTYTNPLVTMEGHFQSRWFNGIAPLLACSSDGSTVSYNYIGIVIKRVSSTQWLELRVNSTSTDMSVLGMTGTIPKTVELWCSHNSSGTLTTTKLQDWNLPFNTPISDPARNPMTIKVWIDTSNVVNISITGVDYAGNPITTMTQSYSLSASLISLFGSAVAGSVGQTIKSDNFANVGGSGAYYPNSWSSATSNCGFPWIRSFQAQKFDVPNPILNCPVIGDVDTPQRIVLAGDMVNPFIQISDALGGTSTAYFTGTVSNSNPVTVDLSDGSVKDSGGSNKYAMLSSTSDFIPFQPGMNRITLGAFNWGTYPVHAYAWWRNALR